MREAELPARVRNAAVGEPFDGCAVGHDALTLITPLDDYPETDTFQLSYKSRGGVRRYTYTKGRAVVFGSRFEHSTEPGKGRDGEPHVYLCFTFGTDRQDAWASIARTLGTQSRIVRHPDGALRLTKVGEQIEEALAAMS